MAFRRGQFKLSRREYSEMKLKLENFRCHKKAEFVIPDAGLVLLSGMSGAGKTTILNALVYALYGKLSKPYSHDQTKCCVKIEDYRIPGSDETLTITRSSPGSRLKVAIGGGKEFEDDGAQGVIDGLIAPHEKFLLSSYVAQRLNSSILSLPPRDQVLFIKALASVGDCNNAFRTRVQTKIDHYEARANHLKGERAVIDRQLESVVIPSPAPPKTETDPDAIRDTLQTLERQLAKIRTAIETLSRKKDALETEASQQARAVTLENEIKALHIMLSKLDFCNDSAIEELETESAFLKRAASFLTATDDLKRLQTDLGNVPDSHYKTLKTGLLSPEANESYQKECETLQNDYDKAVKLSTEVADAKKELAAIAEAASTLYKTKVKKGPAALQAFFEKKTRLLEKAGEQSRQTIADLSQKAAVTNLTKTRYECPACKAELTLEDGTLTPFQQPPLETEQRPDYPALLCEAQQNSAQLEKQLTDLTVLAHRFSLIVETSKRKVLPASKITLLSKKIANIKKALLTSDRNRRELEIFTKNEKIMAGRRTAVETILAAGDKEKLGSWALDDVKTRMDFTVEKLTRFQVNKERAVEISSEIRKKQSLLDAFARASPTSSCSLDQVASQLKEFQTRQRDIFITFQDTQKELARALEYQAYETEKARHAGFLKEARRLKNASDETNGKILGFQGLNALCKKADIVATDSSIAEINFNAALYTKDLFADPIQIALSRIRTTLKGDRRDGMTTNVVYKGSSYSSLDQLSGGERQRCNLAFILAVNDIVGSPFLLLDECLNNLDGDTHAEILGFLRQACHGKLLLVVAHEAAIAKFDEVVVV